MAGRLRTRTTSLIVAVCAISFVPGAAHSATSPTALRSVAYGVVDLGDRVPYRVEGAGCESVAVRVRVWSHTFDISGADSLPLHDGIDPSGCTGAANVPSFNDLTAVGWRQGVPISIEMTSDAGTVPLRYARIEVDGGIAAAGNPTVVASDDPDTGSYDHAMSMSGGDSVSLGHVNVAHIDSFSLRLCLTVGASMPATALTAVLEQRHEAPVYVSVRQASPAGPALVGTTDAASNLFTDDRLSSEGFGNGCWRLLTLPINGRPIADAPELFLTIDAAPQGGALINSLDVNGTGAKLANAPQEDPAGMTTIFDGTTFAGWTQTGCELRDGAATNVATADPTSFGECNMKFKRPIHNVVMRFDVRRESFYDNGAIYMPSEIQLRSAGEYLPGGYFGEYAARWEKLNVFPDWSRMEIVQLGARYVVSINGRTVTDHTTSSAPNAYTFGLATQPEWSYRWGVRSGFGGMTYPTVTTPSDWGHYWFRNVRLYECASATDPVCTSLADARVGEAPAK